MADKDDYFEEKIEEARSRVPTMEHMLGIGLMQPFNNTNSGPRKLMHTVHRTHVFPMISGEKAMVETGYEIRYGDYSSSVTATDSDYQVIAKISKFSFAPNHHYYLIVRDIRNKRLDIIERVSYFHITESYGYLYNNQYLDSLYPGAMIPDKTIVQKSLAFDEYNNRTDGRNLNIAYLSLDQNMEDSVIVSDEAAKKFVSPLVQTVEIMINENNIPLNIYGTEEQYKCIPDIGEDIKDSVLIALRKEKKEEILYTQSVENLRRIMMSDDKKLLQGKVIDVDIMCNNLENLEAYHNQQFKMYQQEKERCANEIVQAVAPYVGEKYEISHELDKLYGISKLVVNRTPYIDKKPFSNILLKVTVLKELPLNEGDKVSNRFGGKGVISKILPKEMMGKTEDGEYIDIIMNSSTMYNRENPGQIFESSLTHISSEIIKRISTGEFDIDTSFEMILKYLKLVVPDQAEYLRNTIANMNLEQKRFLLESFVRDGSIDISSRPISDSFDIDRLRELYKAFPWITQQRVLMPIKDSNGNLRFIPARRPIVVGKEYIFRLKQFAEEKFSATSLSSTNIRSENTKSKANKNFNEMYSNTPIRFGNMEINDLNHLGAETVIQALMIHSVSPHARRLVEKLYTYNPYDAPNIELDADSTNRNVEVVNAYLRTIGKRLVFKKIKKQRIQYNISPLRFEQDAVRNPIFFNNEENHDWEADYKRRDELRAAKEKNPGRSPIYFEGIDLEKEQKQKKINEIARKQRNATGKELRDMYKDKPGPIIDDAKDL